MCGQYNVDVLLFLATLMAESGLNPKAERFGFETLNAQQAINAGDWVALQAIIDRTKPDISFGYTQLIVGTAAGYGIGNGQHTVENVLDVRDRLFNRHASLDLGAQHLLRNMASPSDWGDDWRLQTLIAYNSGSHQPRGNWYWQRYQQNIQNYLGCLIWAENLLKTQGG